MESVKNLPLCESPIPLPEWCEARRGKLGREELFVLWAPEHNMHCDALAPVDEATVKAMLVNLEGAISAMRF